MTARSARLGATAPKSDTQRIWCEKGRGGGGHCVRKWDTTEMVGEEGDGRLGIYQPTRRLPSSCTNRCAKWTKSQISTLIADTSMLSFLLLVFIPCIFCISTCVDTYTYTCGGIRSACVTATIRSGSSTGSQAPKWRQHGTT